MKHLRLEKLLFFVTCFFSLLGTAQVSTDFDGKYIGQLDSGGFEDSVIIDNGTFTHIRNKAWGYGVEHQFVYSMTALKGEMITFEQIAYLKDRIKQPENKKIGTMNGQTVVFAKDGNENLEIIYPGLSEIMVFEKISD